MSQVSARSPLYIFTMSPLDSSRHQVNDDSALATSLPPVKYQSSPVTPQQQARQQQLLQLLQRPPQQPRPRQLPRQLPQQPQEPQPRPPQLPPHWSHSASLNSDDYSLSLNSDDNSVPFTNELFTANQPNPTAHHQGNSAKTNDGLMFSMSLENKQSDFHISPSSKAILTSWDICSFKKESSRRPQKKQQKLQIEPALKNPQVAMLSPIEESPVTPVKSNDANDEKKPAEKKPAKPISNMKASLSHSTPFAHNPYFYKKYNR